MSETKSVSIPVKFAPLPEKLVAVTIPVKNPSPSLLSVIPLPTKTPKVLQ